MDLRARLRRGLSDLGLGPDADLLEALLAHRDLLLDWNPTAGLVSTDDARPEGLLRHQLESLQALPHLRGPGPVVDVGAGGGFPGLIWALADRERRCILVEGSTRKAAFLREAARVLALGQVVVEHRRLENAADLAGLGGRILTSRAAAAADLLLEAASISSGDSQVSHGEDLVLVLYPGQDEANRLSGLSPAGLTLVADEPLISGAAGRLLVWRSSSPTPF